MYNCISILCFNFRNTETLNYVTLNNSRRNGGALKPLTGTVGTTMVNNQSPYTVATKNSTGEYEKTERFKCLHGTYWTHYGRLPMKH